MARFTLNSGYPGKSYSFDILSRSTRKGIREATGYNEEEIFAFRVIGETYYLLVFPNYEAEPTDVIAVRRDRTNPGNFFPAAVEYPDIARDILAEYGEGVRRN